MEFYAEEPFGFDIEDTRAALHALVVMRSQGDKRSKLEDFRLKRRAAPLGVAEDKEVLKNRLRALFGGAPKK